MAFFAKILVGAVIAVGAFFSGTLFHQAPMAGNFNPTGGGTYLLQSSISSSQTTITLTSFTEPGSNLPYTMSYMNTEIGYGTIAPSSGNSEFVSFTGIVQNANGTATLTGVLRGLSRTPGTGGCVASTTLAHAFPGQTQFILSNSPCFYSQYAVKQNPEGISASWSFYQLPTSTTTATTSYQFVNKALLDATAAQGAATSTESNGGIVELGTLAEQASSFDGGVAKPTVLQTKNSTSTCQVVGSYNIVASTTSGKLDKNCFDQTLPYSFTAASSTNFGFTGGVTLGGIGYTFKSASRQSSSTVLAEDGSGGLSFVSQQSRTLENTSNTTRSTNSTSSSTITTVTVSANTVGTTVSLEGSATFTNRGSVACYFDMQLGNGTASTSVYSNTLADFNSVRWMNFKTFATSTASQITSTTGYRVAVSVPYQSGQVVDTWSPMTPYDLTAKTYIAVIGKAESGTTCLLSGLTVKVISQ